MSAWGRVDGDFPNHPKILALGSKGRRWTWLEVLAYTWRYDSPVIPATIRSAVPGATEKFLAACENVGLIDLDNTGSRVVHDWVLFTNAHVDAKVSYYLSQNPDATSNDVVAATRCRRSDVLHSVHKYRETLKQSQNGGSSTGSQEPHMTGTTEPPNPVPEVVPSTLRNATEVTGTSAVEGNPKAVTELDQATPVEPDHAPTRNGTAQDHEHIRTTIEEALRLP